jgi:hypothetical protein
MAGFALTGGGCRKLPTPCRQKRCLQQRDIVQGRKKNRTVLPVRFWTPQ